MDGLRVEPDGAALLPAPAPLAMPVRPLDALPPRRAAPPRGPRGLALRRLLVLGGAVVLTSAATMEMSLVLGLARWTAIGLVLSVLFAALFFWIALACTSALAGFVVMLRGAPPAGPPRRQPHSRTALLMPVYNEATPRIAAALEAMRASLGEAAPHFDIFVLSDSTDAAARRAEWQAVLRLRTAPGPTVFYRHRADNAGRKAGNIAEWVRRFGAAYEHFVILDADSLMQGETLLALVACMEDDPDAALLQTLPLLHGGRTLFARLQQFAAQVQGPLIAHGIAWWHGADSNYWGHNAIIRTRAFAACCGLPQLPGRKPFGGDIMSHDFVEAALLRRAGWGVRLLPWLPGSHEEGPPSLPDMAVRDRRWCQGNLQHAAVLGARGLHPMSRLHMVMGVAAYACAPLWLGFLVLGIAVSLQARFLRPDYFPKAHALFPQWPVVDADRAVWMFGATLLVLLLPKLLGVIAFAASPAGPRGVAATLRLGAGAGLEILLSALLSPIMMLTQSAQCIGVLRGVDGGWAAQRRDGAVLTLRGALRLAWSHSLLGLALGLLALAVAPLLAAWMAPVLLGLILAPVLIVMTASVALGDALRARGCLTTPTEAAPSALLRDYAAALNLR
jgi:membrane glycosyltransferase